MPLEGVCCPAKDAQARILIAWLTSRMAVLVPPSFEGVQECGVVGVEWELMLDASAEEVWRGSDGKVIVEGVGVLHVAGVSGSSAGEAATATFTRASNLVLLPPLAGCG